MSYKIIDNQCYDSSPPLNVQTTSQTTGSSLSAINISYSNFKFTQSLDTQKTKMKLKCSVSQSLCTILTSFVLENFFEKKITFPVSYLFHRSLFVTKMMLLRRAKLDVQAVSQANKRLHSKKLLLSYVT